MNEYIVEHAALGWFKSLGSNGCAGADISPDAEACLRESYEHVVLEPRLRAGLGKLNVHLPEEAVDQAIRVVTRPPEPTLEQNNR